MQHCQIKIALRNFADVLTNGISLKDNFLFVEVAGTLLLPQDVCLEPYGYTTQVLGKKQNISHDVSEK